MNVTGETRSVRGGWWRAMVILGVGVWSGGCDSGEGGRGAGTARYPSLAGTSATPVVAGALTNDPLAAMRTFASSNPAVLSVLQTEISPGTLWHTAARQVSIFGDLARSGLGAPTFLAYSSPTGIAVVQPGGLMAGEQMRENWLLAGFPGATGWTEWDSPWAIFLQQRPVRVGLGTNGVTLDFDRPAGFWTLMPLYGVYRPPQKDREVLKPQGLKEKGMQTWEWPVVVARDPLTRLRYWAGATRRFPLRLPGEVGVSGERGVVLLRERFQWLEIPDAWSTRPVVIAPVPPALGLVLTKGQTFPVEFSKAPFDFEMPTVYGPWFGLPESAEYTMRFRVLQYVNEAEVVSAPERLSGSAEAPEVIESLRVVGREVFGAPTGYRPEGGEDWASMAALDGYLWQARALEFFDPEIRSNAVVRLGQAMWERVLVPERFADRAEGGAAGSDRQDWAWVSSLVQSAWAVAHATGDREKVRERWPLVRRVWSRHGAGTWVGFGGGETATLGDGAAPAIAFARLAWLAGDLEGYREGCGMVARELALLYGRLRGGRWFREQQPWSPGPIMPEGVAPQRLREGPVGWEVSGPGYPGLAGTPWPGERWVRFRDWDVARFCRDHLAGDVRREMGQLEAGTGAGAGGLEASGWVGVVEMGFSGRNETQTAAGTARVGRGLPPVGEGQRTARLARGLSELRGRGWVAKQRLIPAVELEGGESGVGAVVRNAHLVQTIEAGAEGRPGWPRVRWVDWPTPAGVPWEMGEVRVGDGGVPARVGRLEGLHGTQWEVEVSVPTGR